ncbi:MAG TPA: bifunctional serine/threonine-protein kinase/ABC transporter substrate-binding protein, partial [Phototrophicaceae bacterium]|nr:bifunctional serine/threonine-protein kinase/ABC transporter substrate-binding protein [Phototrophicaceae bacterium]
MNGLENQQVGEFVLREQIGHSSFATVYRAYQPSVNRYVAIKVIGLQPESLGSESAIFERRFVQEAHVLTTLEHPHIVPIYHYGLVDDEYAYIAMRLMQRSLREMLQHGPLPLNDAINITLQLIEGLKYAHNKGVSHRDLKPANVLFDEAGSACLSDFGMIKAAAASVDLTKPGLLTSTAMYVSPEQIRSAGADHRSDIYSLGVLMYQMLTGRLPFEVENLSIISLLHKIEYDEPVPPRQYRPEIPPALENVVLQALRKEPRERFYDVKEMALALEGGTSRSRLRSVRVLRAPIPKSMKPSSLRYWRSPAVIGVLLAVVVALILIALIIDLSRQNSLPKMATVVAHTTGQIDDAVPSAAEISQAQSRLGANGVIAYIACNLDSQFDSARADEMKSFAQADGLAYRVYDSAGDGYQEQILIEQARLDGAKAIILCPLKPDLLADSLASVQSADVPLVLTDPLDQNYGGVMLDPNNRAIGQAAGQFIGATLAAQSLSNASVVILADPNIAYSADRVSGFTAALKEALPGAKLVAQLPTGDDQDASQSALARLIASGQTPNAIFSVSDSGAYGAVAALAAAHVAPSTVL